jgi:tRNA A58 N-methylase Trm61
VKAIAPVTLAVLVLVLVGAGCGGDDEPSYCSELNDLQQSVRNLGDVDIVAGGTNAVRDALAEVEASARSTVDAARSDFPDETSAISESISSLEASAQQLGASPTVEQAGQLAGDVQAVARSVSDLADVATECS